MRAAFAALALLGLAAGIDCRAESVFINLRPEAEVDRPEVRLADIAEIVTRNPSNAEQLGGTVVTKCPSLARPCHLGKADIVAAVQSRAMQSGANLIWGSSESVTIRGRMRPLSLAPAVDRAAIRILQQMDQGFPLAVGMKEGPASIDVPPGVAEVRPEFDQMRWVGTGIELPINVMVDGTSVAKPIIRYVVRRGIVPAIPETTLSPAGARTGDRYASGRRPAGSGASDVQNDDQLPERLAVDTAVAKNKKVRLLIDSGPVRIEAEGIALADADVGGTVRVRRANGLADVRGRAIDRGTVLVEEK